MEECVLVRRKVNIMATKTIVIRDPRSCFNRANADEPIFVLIGRDGCAPAAVRAWIAERVYAGKNAVGDAQILEAHAAADEMERFYRANYIAITGEKPK